MHGMACLPSVSSSRPLTCCPQALPELRHSSLVLLHVSSQVHDVPVGLHQLALVLLLGCPGLGGCLLPLLGNLQQARLHRWGQIMENSGWVGLGACLLPLLGKQPAAGAGTEVGTERTI